TRVKHAARARTNPRSLHPVRGPGRSLAWRVRWTWARSLSDSMAVVRAQCRGLVGPDDLLFHGNRQAARQRLYLTVVVRRGELGRGDGLDAVLKVELRQLAAQAVAHAARPGAAHAVLIDLGTGRDGQRALCLVLDEGPPLVRVEALVDLIEPALRRPHDPATLSTVQDRVPVIALQ